MIEVLLYSDLKSMILGNLVKDKPTRLPLKDKEYYLPQIKSSSFCGYILWFCPVLFTESEGMMFHLVV